MRNISVGQFATKRVSELVSRARRSTDNPVLTQTRLETPPSFFAVHAERNRTLPPSPPLES